MPRPISRQLFALLLCGAFWILCGGPLHAAGSDRLINISSRTQVGTGADVMIAGFIIGPGSSKQVLIRAIGPTLSGYGVNGVLADPLLTLYDSTGTAIDSNDNWTSADTAAISAAGATTLPAGSKDAVLVETLPPGAYTAIVSGLNNTTGIALVEVFEIDGTSRLMNISTRAQVGAGAAVMISGLIVGPGSTRHILLRALGPTLKNFSINDALPDPKITVFDGSGKAIASNDNWGDTDPAGISAATTAAGAAGFSTGSKDSALVLDLPPGGYTAQVSSVDGSAGVALIEAYDITAGANTPGGPVAAPEVVSVSATTPTTALGNPVPAAITFTRSGDLSAPLTVSYAMSGDAVSGIDYTGANGSVTFGAGSPSAVVSITPLASTNTGSKIATLTVNANAAYSVATASAQVTLYYSAGTLYFANLRTSSSATASTAYGTATVQLSPDETTISATISYSNLSSGETDAHLFMQDGTTTGIYLFKLPAGTPASTTWVIKATAGYSVAQIVAALKAGNVYVELDTVNYPSGELNASLLSANGSQSFTPPAAPPALPSGAPTAQDAARFLMQATFGPTKAEIDALTQSTLDTWITNQMTLPASSHRTETVNDFNTYNTSPTTTKPTSTNRQESWWKIAVTGQDQLRQRVAFALSEIFVISDQNSTVGNWEEAVANYNDLLANDAFGNFRTLLEDVTLSPMMGVYLSSIKNSKATSTTEPDENYAREVMQLFTVGLNQLQPDGSLKLDASGLPIPTYDQTVVSTTARVFTGWQFHNAAPTKNNFRSGGSVIDDYVQPMTLNPNFHDTGAKTIIGGLQLPANQDGATDLKQTLDALFNHPNTGPFFCRQLIQRLVTSNPSPAYVYRVAKVFADNGSGVRGDLGAVVRAILLDYEARSTDVLRTPGAGKLKEPLLRMSALLRAFSGAADNGRYAMNPDSSFGQSALHATTVFNFFTPDYVSPGVLGAAGLYAPEFQIVTGGTAITAPNTLYNTIYATRGATTIGLTYTVAPDPSDPVALVDYLNLVLTANSMSSTIHDRIVAALTAMPKSTTTTEKYRSAIYLVVSTQSAAVQK
jgi:uncharacterized protein (DUF1800 family)